MHARQTKEVKARHFRHSASLHWCTLHIEHRTIYPTEIVAVSCRPNHGRDLRVANVECIDLRQCFWRLAEIRVETLVGRRVNSITFDEIINAPDKLRKRV